VTWQDVPAFLVRHVYAAGEAPRDHHPHGWGRLEFHRFGKLGNGWHVAVHSTKRRKDGWSFNVVELEARPIWVAYYHHAPTDKRVREANSPNALHLAQVFDAL
jgi:hypothetical protein